MNETPKIPHKISSDGREIWDWAGEFSAYVHRQDKIRELNWRIQEQGKFCGDCSLWMTKACPKEVHSNTTGRSTGPHMNAWKCVEFVENSATAKLRTELIAELERISQP